MRIRELSTDQCLEFLSRMTLGHLGCARAGQPYVVPIHFSCDAERKCLYGFSALGQKITWMRDNPQVCLEVAEIADKDRWTTVLVFGRFEEVEDDADARQRVWDRLRDRPEWWLPATAKTGSHESHAALIYRIEIKQLTGRSASRARS
jgi:nitroimidazol reductase NimA-like FMN-containing flavoprotein (pyridoxamine 5'-phosphate oxidase superfamily)